MLNKILLPSFLLFGITSCQIIVDLPNGNGQINGIVQTTQMSNKTFYSFLQIPYGEPPVGKLRFMAPQPAKNWDGVLDCTQNRRICYQVNGNTADYENEDCLYINVYTPIKPGSRADLPVMYYIFGGGFVGGSSTFDPASTQFFMDGDIVLVSVNYRIGPFGFLSTNDDVILGNNGLKDQQLGLKWVQENIHIFGGDPTKVTIFGLSAGGASVTYQYLNQNSAGLFRGGIAESGSYLCPWSYQRHAKSIAYQLANLIDPTFNDSRTSQELLEFLQSVDSKEIDAASGNIPLSGEEMVQGFRYAPIVEPDVEGAFITEGMYETLLKGNINKVPLMIGICSEEQIGRAGDINGFKNSVHNYEQDLSQLVNEDFHIEDVNDRRDLGAKIRQIYAGDGLLEDNLAGAVKYFSDTSFSRPIIHQAKLQSQLTDVYLYEFSYHGALGNNGAYVEGADRVTHAEDNNYLWVSNSNNVNADDLLTVRRYTELYINFAKSLNPTPGPSEVLGDLLWPKVDANNFQFLNINNTLEVQKDLKGEAYQKWVELYDNYAVRPLDTY